MKIENAMRSPWRKSAVPIAVPLFLTMWLMTTHIHPTSAQNPGMRTTGVPEDAALVYDGFTQPLHDIMVAASDIGILRSLDVKIGDRVEKGQVLGRLDDELQVSAVKLAEIQAAMTGATDATKIEVALQKQRAATLHELASREMARPDEVRRSDADYEIALARDLAAREQIELHKLELERFQLQLNRRFVVAPDRGVVSEVFREIGEYISPNEPVLLRLLVMDRLIAKFNVPAEEIPHIKIGTPARVYLRSTRQMIETQITWIAPNIDGESGTVEVRAELNNEQWNLRPGDRCTLTVNGHREPANAVSTVSQNPTSITEDSLAR